MSTRRPPIRAALFAAVFIGSITAPAAAFHEANACGGSPGTSSPADVHSDNIEYVDGHNGFTGGHIFVDNEILYVGSYGIGFRMYDITDPANPVCIAEIHATGIASADSVPDAAIFDGRTIVALGGTGRIEGAPVPELNTDRTDFYDVTDPEAPVHLWTLGPDQIDGEAHNADIFDDERLWLPSGGGGDRGLRIYDMNPLLEETPAEPTELFPVDTGLDPTELWDASPYRGDKPVGDPFTHTHDITIYPDHPVEGFDEPRDIILLAEGGAYLQGEPTAEGNTGSIFVIDITDPESPVVLFRWLHDEEYDDGEDHHGIRYHHEVQFLDGSPNVMLVTDEDLHSTPGCLEHAAGFTAVQLTDDLQSGEELSEFFIPDIGPPAAVCSAHVFNSYGDFVFVGSYNAGLQVFDYSDPAAPEQAGYYIAAGATSWGAYFYEGYVYMGDVSRGLDVLRFLLPDLVITPDDIAVPSSITSGDQVTITATVANLGGADVEGAVIRFTVDGVAVGTDQVIGSIPIGGTGTASVTWDTTGLTGEHEIVVTADPDGAIEELDEDNNTASRMATVVASSTGSPSPTVSPSATASGGASPTATLGPGGRSPSPSPAVRVIPNTAGEWIGGGTVWAMALILVGGLTTIGLARYRATRNRRG